MATIRLIPSAYTSSNSSYATVYSGEANMYNNTDHTANYASLRGRNNSTTTAYYIFLRGFNFNDVPSNATVTDFTVKIRCYKNSYQRTGDNYRLRLASSTNINNVIADSITSTEISTTASVINIPTGDLDWDTLSDYGSNFSIVIPLSSTSSSRPYIYVYGAEIEVTYTLGPPRDITTSITGDGTISPSGTNTYYDGENVEVVITPTYSGSAVTATRDGTNITSQLVHHVPGGSVSDDRVLGTYALVSGSFNGSGATYFQGLVGKGHTASQTTSNYYSGGSSTIAVFTYDISFDIPSTATVTSLYVMVNGHAESTSQSSEYMCAQIISGSTALSSELNFKSIGTSNTTQTITATTLPTPAQCANLKLQCRLGYYGGAINGATVYIEYEDNTPEHYTYDFIVDGDTTITVIVGNVTTYNVNVSNSATGVTVTPTSQSVVEGADATIRIDAGSISNITVTDNNVNVTNQLVSHTSSGTSATKTYIPSSFDSTNSSYESVYSSNGPENGLTSHTSSTRCCVYAHTANGSESYLYYNFDCSDIPINAVITSVTCQVGASCYSSGSYFSTHTLQLCTGTNEKGTAVTTTGNGSTSTVQTVDGGSSWTRAELDDIKIRFKIVRSQTGEASFSFFGATLTVEYTVPGETYWTYTISNVQAAHTIVVTGDGVAAKIYIKVGGTWTQYSKVYKKTNGSWVEQNADTWQSLFNTSTNYRKMN